MPHKDVGNSQYNSTNDDIYSSGAYDIIREHMRNNSHRESFKEAIASIICDSLDARDVSELRDLLTDYVE